MHRFRRPSPAVILTPIVLVSGSGGTAVAIELIENDRHRAGEHRSVIRNAPLGERTH